MFKHRGGALGKRNVRFTVGCIDSVDWYTWNNWSIIRGFAWVGWLFSFIARGIRLWGGGWWSRLFIDKVVSLGSGIDPLSRYFLIWRGCACRRTVMYLVRGRFWDWTVNVPIYAFFGSSSINWTWTSPMFTGSPSSFILLARSSCFPSAWRQSEFKCTPSLQRLQM